jgi:regulator of sigma E protease
MNVLKVILIIFEVVLLFNLVILVHELGHFLAARWRGLKVERFGIWFGRPLWEKKINGVTYCLGTIPAGGYVALPQMAPMETIEGKTESGESLPPISPLDKIIVAFAGPLFSLLLAVAFAVIVWGIGRPVSERETTTVIGYVHPFIDAERTTPSPAAAVGLQPGDKILEIDGHKVNKFAGMGDDSVTWRIVRSEGETIHLKVQRDGAVLDLHPVPIKQETKGWERRGLRQIGIEPAFTPMVGRVAPHSPAAMAGLQPNDLIVEANGRTIFHPVEFSRIIRDAGTSPVQVKALRDGRTFERVVTPEVPISGEQVPRIGVEWDRTGKMDLIYPGPIQQVRSGVNAMIDTFGALFSPKSDIGPQHLSGPVGIMRIYYLLFESDQGWRLAIWFSVILNINLAILNLLPIPVLDGGHITLALIESVRRRPINVRILNYVQTACALLVIGYILYVTFYDVQDLKPDRHEPAPEMQFAPKPDPSGSAPNSE